MIRGYTKREKKAITYEWKIEEVDTYLSINCNSSKIIESTKFSSGSSFEDQWCIKTVFNDGDAIKVNLCLLEVNSSSIDTKYSFYILDNKKEKVFMKNYHKLLYKGECTYLCIPKKDLNDDKDQYLPDNSITVCLDLIVYNDHVTAFPKYELKIPKRLITQDLKQLYLTKMGGDVVINVGDKKFRVHKAILMARSCVLTAMFFHDMVNRKENTLIIPDIDPEIFEKVLEFIYTDQVTDLDANAERLLEVAHKYQLHSLKEMCQESLSKTLTLETGIKLLILANLYNANHLLEFVTDFLVFNINQIIDTLEFQQLEKSNPALALKLLKKHSFPKHEEQSQVTDQ